jgi:hypothetical protein
MNRARLGVFVEGKALLTRASTTTTLETLCPLIGPFAS